MVFGQDCHGSSQFWVLLYFYQQVFFILPGGVAYTPSPPVCICVCARVCRGGGMGER
jgi:hypothetical protein